MSMNLLIVLSVLILVLDALAGLFLLRAMSKRAREQGGPDLGPMLLLSCLLGGVMTVAALWYFFGPGT